jgi:hypothetical protein
LDSRRIAPKDAAILVEVRRGCNLFGVLKMPPEALAAPPIARKESAAALE